MGLHGVWFTAVVKRSLVCLHTDLCEQNLGIPAVRVHV